MTKSTYKWSWKLAGTFLVTCPNPSNFSASLVRQSVQAKKWTAATAAQENGHRRRRKNLGQINSKQPHRQHRLSTTNSSMRTCSSTKPYCRRMKNPLFSATSSSVRTSLLVWPSGPALPSRLPTCPNVRASVSHFPVTIFFSLDCWGFKELLNILGGFFFFF